MPDHLNPVRSLLSGTSLIALCLAPPVFAQTADTGAAEQYAAVLTDGGSYLAGDKHNHTTCTDGSTSVRTLVDQSAVVYDLDWFAQTGHGGSGSRDCRFDDVQSGNFFPVDEFPELQLERSNSREFWVDTIGIDALKGDREELGEDEFAEMWRWQSLIEYAYPDVANAGRISDKTTWLGLETNVPGHEHTAMGILGEQFRRDGDAYAMGQFEYLWDRGDRDTSGGEDLEFENPANNGVQKIENVPGNHEKAVQSVTWLRNNYRRNSYYVPAHIDRQGGYSETGDFGFNVEHVRDLHNAGLFNPNNIEGPSVSFGAEFAPGHQMSSARGTYDGGRPTSCFGTFGGAGCYGAGEMSVPGTDLDGTPLTEARLAEIATEFDEAYGGNPFTSPINTEEAIERYVIGRPGVKTMWDALLGEGRRYFIFYSSDWHNRGAFGPFEPHSTLDAWPGEQQKIYAYARGSDGGYNHSAAFQVVAGMRAGNSWSVMGDLIDDLSFIMCQGSDCATMGQTLHVDPDGPHVVWYVKLRDPEGANHSPYTFNNPSLLQIGQEVPINEPVFDNIDIIRGDITGPIAPTDPEYRTNVSNASTEIFGTVFRDGFTVEGEYLTYAGEIPAETFTNGMYFRMRGTNMPKGTPNETDADGNPLIDFHSNNIPCPFPYEDPDPETALTEFNPASCPAYLPVNERLPGTPQVVDFDVEAWSDLWFHANPIFVEPRPVREANLR